MDRIEVQNVGRPGKTYREDAAKFMAMKAAVLAVLPRDVLGMSVPDLVAAVEPLLPPEHFLDGATAGRWVKLVQLDQETKGVIARAPKAPVRLWVVLSGA
jgi:hypothetical protein